MQLKSRKPKYMDFFKINFLKLQFVKTFLFFETLMQKPEGELLPAFPFAFCSYMTH